MAVIFHSNANAAIDALTQAKKKALRIIGGKAETYAKKICPVGTPESTGIPGYVGGTLKGSIANQPYGDSAVVIGTNIEYAPYVELGTVKMKAKPYLRPAVEDHMDEYANVIKGEVGKVI